MKMLLFDKDERRLRDIKMVFKAEHDSEINGEDTLKIEVGPQDREIEKGDRILYKSPYGYWNEFIIEEIDVKNDRGQLTTVIFAESSIYELLGDYVEDKRPSGSAQGALNDALLTTRWSVGDVDDLGNNNTNFYRSSALDSVRKVVEVWEGELRTRVDVDQMGVVARYIDIKKKIGRDLGKRFTYTKDLESVEKKTHRTKVYTALYGYGKGEEIGDGYGRRINFSSVNNGKAYVENLDALAVYGRNGPNGKVHVFGKVEFDDCEDKEELLELTLKELETASKPLVTYKATVLDLGSLGFEHEGVDLGDAVGIIDDEIGRLKARIIAISRDLLYPENTTLTLGNFIPNLIGSNEKQFDMLNNFRGKTGIWDRAGIIDEDGRIQGSHIGDLLDSLNHQMNATGGYTYVSEGEGWITYDKPIDQNPTMAIEIKGGALRIANSKLQNGNWNWQTFGTGDGFTANLIRAGILEGGKIKFDLENGTFLIGNSPEDYNLYFDGSSLKFRVGGKSIEEKFEEYPTKDDILNDEDIQESLKGDKGDTGDDGISVSRVEQEFYLSNSSTSQTGGSWSNTPPTWVKGKHLWARQVTYYTDNTSTSGTPVLDKEWQALNDIEASVDRIASTGYITPAEKQNLSLKLAEIVQEHNAYSDSVATEVSGWGDYHSAYLALGSYLSDILDDMGATSQVDPSVFNGKFSDYYDGLEALKKAIEDKRVQDLLELVQRITNAEILIEDDRIVQLIEQSELFRGEDGLENQLEQIRNQASSFETNIYGFISETFEEILENEEQILEVSHYFKFEEGVVKLGNSLSAIYMQQENNRLAFMEGDYVHGYISNESAYFKKFYGDELNLGGYQTIVTGSIREEYYNG